MRSDRHVKGIVDGLLKKIEENVHKKGDVAKEAWKSVNNEDLKKHAKLINLKRETLIVKVDNSSWLYKFTLEKKRIIEEFNAGYKKKKKIKGIMFRIGTLQE